MSFKKYMYKYFQVNKKDTHLPLSSKEKTTTVFHNNHEIKFQTQNVNT